MATLVLSTVGTALGGPVGAAIGALIGQSIDQQLLGGSARGPRIGDLSVQTSSYGTQIPRVYGTMRVAGSIIWSTDLVEGAETAGAKGQPDTTFSYSVSFAVAVSSRPIRSIGRIWADGKLIRGSDGLFKVPATLRVHDGGEGQAVDQLIASIEGVANTPAYRGLALAVFEDLELAEFGNRIPFLTFEVVADDAPPAVQAIVADASGEVVQADCDTPITGFAAHGASIGAAVAPLIDAFGLRLFDDGVRLRPTVQIAPRAVSDAMLGHGAGDEQAPRVEVEQASAAGLPVSLRLAHYEQAHDFQSAEARASVSDQAGIEQRFELPAVVGRELAEAIAGDMLARRWAEREKRTLRLPPEFLALEPGTIVELEGKSWRVERCTIDRFVVIAELVPHRAAALVQASALAAGPLFSEMRMEDAVADDDFRLALFEVPALEGQLQTQPTLLLAASASGSGWRSQLTQLEVGRRVLRVATARRKSVLGQLMGAVPAASPGRMDQAASIEVQLLDQEQWLTSCEDAALDCGENLAIIGRELVQFGDARPLGDGRFRLSRLVRGVAGTEPSEHAEQSVFCLAQPDSLRSIPLPSWSKGREVVVRARRLSGREVSASVIVSDTPLNPPIPLPEGGATVDTEARAALGAALEAMRRHGLIES